MSRGGQRRADPVDDAREINRRVRRLERRRPDTPPTVSSSSSGFDATATITSLAVVDGDLLDGTDFTWTGLTNCTESGGLLTTARTGSYAISAHATLSGLTDGYTNLKAGNITAWNTGWIGNDSVYVSAAGISRGANIAVEMAWYGITASTVDVTLYVWGYPLELD